MHQCAQRMVSVIADRVWFASMRALGDRIAGCYVMIPPAPNFVYTMSRSARASSMSGSERLGRVPGNRFWEPMERIRAQRLALPAAGENKAWKRVTVQAQNNA